MRRAIFLVAAALTARAQVPYERIVKASGEPANWLTYSGNYEAHRFSHLTQLTPANVARLRPLWVHQVREQGGVESTPLVFDGVMYVTEPPTAVAALDLRTGRPLWRWERTLPKDLQTIGFGRVNRGVAALGDTLYVGTLDAHLVALDAKSGAVRWDAPVADYKTGHCITVAPLAVEGKIIVGISGGEAGIRGFIDAYDAKTGKRLWRFWTIPGTGEPGNDSWHAADSWKTGGGSTWVTGSYDPDLKLIYWGVGNPGPDWNGDPRPGDNLYTCSLVALDAQTGALRWHFQFTPHDTHDWDATEIPVLLDTVVRGKPRKVVAMANRNGFYYLLDRATGEFLSGVPYAKQTWAKGLDDSGRPVVIAGSEPTEAGNLVWPSLQGATNWFSPSYDPVRQQFYVAVREMGSYYYKGEAEYKPGTFFAGGGERALNGDDAYGAIRALDVSTGRRKWEFRLQSPPWAGVLGTAGGLVFGGSNEGNFYALDAVTGKPLWDFQTGGGIAANPISFLIDGKQVVAIAAGHAIFVFGL
ncbi:MAG TPA: PQQ-dependent dehydrogenase, methanol/ethanol family [Bryobacteraceae bacterium]|nr:PQQ-dependent dehydrogenase, methanol/ethanol family [Bryobacteraceae bacterium]